jgi:hypothetical protein
MNRPRQRGSFATLAVAVALSFSCSSCSQPLEPDDGARSPRGGSRLQAVSWRPIEGGASVFGGWRDTAKGVDCAIKRTGPSTAACLPIVEVVEWTQFGDPDCRRPIAASVDGAAREQQIVSDLCTGAIRAYRRGAVPALMTIFQRDSWDGSCIARDVPQMAFPLEDVTAEYVGLDAQLGSARGGIAARLLIGGDGARDFDGWWDSQRGASCTFPWLGNSEDVNIPWLAEDGSWRCFPARGKDYVDTFQIQDRFRFGDAQCSSFSAFVPQVERCKPGRFDYWWGDYAYHSLTCQSRAKVWGLGPAVDTAYHRAAGGCVPDRAPHARPTRVRKLELLDFRSWPTGKLGPPRGEGRLQMRSIETAAGASAGVLWDATLDIQCRLARRADGEMSCVPGGDLQAGNAFHGDPACTRAILYAARPCPKPRFHSTLASVPQFGRPETYRVFTLEEHSGAIYLKSGSNCVPYSPDPSTLGGPLGGTWHALGPEVPATDLLRLEQVTD